MPVSFMTKRKEGFSMTTNSNIRYGYINIVDRAQHHGQLTRDNVERYTNGFTKPALFRSLAPISPD